MEQSQEAALIKLTPWNSQEAELIKLTPWNRVILETWKYAVQQLVKKFCLLGNQIRATNPFS
jgi:hypothetical protein